jgi:purine catabolism regulatory family protein/PucR-like helix-turn-helix protein
MSERELLTMERLIQSPALQLRLVAGAAGLSRRVAWAHVSELDDPGPWLSGAELIMTTGLGFPRTAARQRDYLERLDDGGVAGLAVSAQLHMPPLSTAFLAAAEARSFPVVEVPLSVPFMAIAQEVAAAVQADSTQRLNAQLQVFGAIRWLTSEELDEEQVFARLERLSGFRLFLCTAQYLPLFPGVPVPPPELRGLLPASSGAPPAVPGGFALPVPVPGGPAGFLLAVERPGISQAGLAVVQHIATVAALQLTMRRHREETLRRERAETLAELLHGSLSREATTRRLARSGFDPSRKLQLLVVRGDPAAVNDGLIARALAEAEVPFLALQQRDYTYVLSHSEITADRKLPAFAGLCIGASRPFDSGQRLGGPRREALWAVARAADAGAPFVRYGDDPIGRWLIEDSAALRSLVSTVLGAVQAYDRDHGIELVRTVQTWMERDRQNAVTAQALHLHPNTLAYRLRRFEEVSGRDLRSTSDLSELWLALRALGHLDADMAAEG